MIRWIMASVGRGGFRGRWARGSEWRVVLWTSRGGDLGCGVQRTLEKSNLTAGNIDKAR